MAKQSIMCSSHTHMATSYIDEHTLGIIIIGKQTYFKLIWQLKRTMFRAVQASRIVNTSLLNEETRKVVPNLADTEGSIFKWQYVHLYICVFMCLCVCVSVHPFAWEEEDGSVVTTQSKNCLRWWILRRKSILGNEPTTLGSSCQVLLRALNFMRRVWRRHKLGTWRDHCKVSHSYKLKNLTA